MEKQKSAIEEAVRLLGGPVKAASAIGVRHYQTVQRWMRDGVVPAEYCPSIERATGRKVTCERLNGDVEWNVLRARKAA